MAWSNPAERIDLGFYAKMYDYMITLFDDAALCESVKKILNFERERLYNQVFGH